MDELYNDVQFGNQFGNFNPDAIDADETINAVFIVDISPSISDYENDLNSALKDFTEEMQKSHIADSLLVSIVEFNDSVNVKSGFQPIANVKLDTFKGSGYGTALYTAVEKGLTNALNYRNQLENSGVNCKTLVFILTDGEDNSSLTGDAAKVKAIHAKLAAEEKTNRNFTTVLFGINDSVNFESAAANMGIPKEFVARVGQTAKDIRKMINWISSSVSSASSSGAISVPNF